jgi:xanthine dehydrogenase large subunit
MSALSERPAASVVGLEIPHESAAEHVGGRALYTDDLVGSVVGLPGVLHLWPVQATHAHALVTQLDPAPALRVPGVVRVLTSADVPGVNDAGVKHDEPLFPTEVMYYGHAVCWVLGETQEAARLGAEAVEVGYEPLPSVVTLAEAIAAESFQGAARTVRRGDPDAGFAAARQVFEGELELGGQEHFYLETHASLAVVDEGGQVFVQSSTQHPSETQEIVAHVLGLRSHDVTVQCLRMGGGFGGKETQPHGYAAIAALGATLTGRPVRLRLNRTQDITMSGKRHPFHASWRVGFDAEGRLTALRATLTSDGGWSLDLSEPVMARALCHVDNAYWVPNIEVRGQIARTNKTSQTAFRGFGGPQGMMVIEDIFGRCAPILGLPPEELRHRNFYAPGQTTPYGQPVRHAERMERIWAQVMASADVLARQRDIEAFNATHRHTKRALAVTPVKFGISFNLTAFNQAGALVHVYKDGSVLVNHGGTEMGQGLHTKMLQVAATALGVPLAAVRLAPTRTDKVPNTSATAASSGADLNGGAVKDACEQIRNRLAQVAAGQFGVNPSDVRFAGGMVTALGAGARELRFAELVDTAYHQRVQLSAAGYYRTEGLHWDPVRMQGEPFKYFAYGAAAAEVEVDGFDGAYRVRRVDIVHDVGDSLSPLVDLGQIEGGFVQGVGWLTLEELLWDESDRPSRGRLATQAASTYKLPSFSEMPEELHVSLFAHATEDGAVYGSKAVGEPPLMLAFSVREALRRAAGAFGPPGHSVVLASPATPEAVFWAVEAARRATPGDAPEAAQDGAVRRAPEAAAAPTEWAAARRPALAEGS